MSIVSGIRWMLFLTLVFAAPLPLQAQEDPSSANIKAAVQPFVDRHVLAGAVMLAADRQSILSLDAVGFADVAGNKPMPTDALFWIASQSKSMTAAAFMMLVQEGKVKLDDPVEYFLPEFKELRMKSGEKQE